MLFAYISLYLKWKINIYVRWNYWLQSEIFCLRLRFNGLGILVGVNEYVNCRKCVTFLSMSVNLIIIEESVLNRLVAVKIIKSIAWLSCERRMCYCEWRSFIYIYLWFTNLLYERNPFREIRWNTSFIKSGIALRAWFMRWTVHNRKGPFAITTSEPRIFVNVS